MAFRNLGPSKPGLALLESLKACATQQVDQSIEKEKEQNDFLKGVPAIVEALRQGQIECRVYTKEKFRAKAYITHAKLAVSFIATA